MADFDFFRIEVCGVDLKPEGLHTLFSPFEAAAATLGILAAYDGYRNRDQIPG